MFKCWEFKGNGDPFFGGSADDRILHRLPDGSLRFVRACDHAALGAVHATFDTKESALAAPAAKQPNATAFCPLSPNPQTEPFKGKRHAVHKH